MKKFADQRQGYVEHPTGDARVLAEAWTCGMDYFVTLDKAHFLDNPGLVPEALPFQLGTPGDFLAWYRDRLRGLGD